MTVDSSTYFLRTAFSSQLKAKVGSTLAKAPALRVNLNIDGTTITYKNSGKKSCHRRVE
jgi:hypothetical protein